MTDLAAIQTRFEVLRAFLDEPARRLWAAAEARALGRGGISPVAAATSLARNTIRQGLRELVQLPAAPAPRVRPRSAPPRTANPHPRPVYPS